MLNFDPLLTELLQKQFFDSLHRERDIIRQWDSAWADNMLKNLLPQYQNNYTKAGKEFIRLYYLNRKIASIIGLVEFNDKAHGKLVDKMRTSKGRAIARIPEILIHGELVIESDLDKERADSYTEFFTIQKRLKFNNGYRDEYILATVKVGLSDKKSIPYYLGARKEKTQYDNVLGIDKQFPRSRFFALQSKGTASRYSLLEYIKSQIAQGSKLFIVDFEV